jgi:thioredoxin-dependent peroxiredoxin
MIPACLNTAMIDLRKATKGRRMSKKRRKKSPVRATLRTASGTSAKKTSSKPRTPSASKSSKNMKNRPDRSSAPKASSHKPQSKALKSAGAKRPVRGTAKAELSDLSTGNGTPRAARAALVEGAKAPAFSLSRDGGGTVSLSDYAGKKLVLFFYPRADTPGCTREAIDFTRLASAFAENHTAILGVSADPLKAQEAFRDKHELSVALASDENHRMLEAYGAWGEKSMYGRTFQGIIRTTVLIGANGQILKVWRHVKVDGHAEQVLALVRRI